MKINKIKVITFSLIFSSIGALGSGCYYNSKRIDTIYPTPPNQTEEQQEVTQNSEANTSKLNQTEVDKPKESITTKASSDATCNSITTPNESQPTSSKIKGENIIPSAKSYATPAKEVLNMINNPSIAKKKIVFLTFDDGPDVNKTPKILTILKENNVHATFFVLGSRLQNQTSRNILMQTYKNGNAIANHSYSHNMKVIYPQNTLCINTFMDEVNQTNTLLKETLGQNFNCAVLRMPGGYNSRRYYNDPNLDSLTTVLKDKGIVSLDWNAENGDAIRGNNTAANLVDNVKKYSQGQKVVVLLMHDIHNTTVQALPAIVKYYKDNGYEFRVISN